MTNLHRLTCTALLGLCSCDAADGTLFDVTAALDSTTCGSGIVDADDSWTFQARLTKDGSKLTWYDVDSGDSSEGTVADGEFSVAAGDTFTVSEATLTTPGCSVRRHEKYSGDITLDEDDEDEIMELDGTLVLEYSEATGYNCDDYIGTSSGFADLPCEIEYTFVATPD